MTQSTIIFDCPLAPWVVAAGAILLLAAVIYFLRRDASQLSGSRRAIILGLVVPADLMLVGLALAPTLVRSWPDTTRPRCAVVVDGSRSMLIEDAYAGDAADWLAKNVTVTDGAAVDPARVRRDAIVRTLLAGKASGWLKSIADEFDVAGWRFSVAAESLALVPGAAPYEVDPQGFSTALGDALDAVTAGGGDAGPRAVVLISDGAWNSGRDPTEVARRLGQQGTAVFVVGVGDPDPPRDAAVVDVRGPRSALLGDELVITARVATSGMGSVRLPVELLVAGRTVETKSVATLPSGQPVGVSFTIVPDLPGKMLYEVRVPRQEGERNEANNMGSLGVEIVERKINVLLVDAEPRWEFRFLRNVLERDPSVKLTVCLLRPGVGAFSGEGYAAALPTDKKDFAAYDLIILGDVPRDSLPDAFLAEAADMVRRRAGSLIVIAGHHENYRRLADTPLAAVLPVTLGGGAGAELKAAEPFSPELTPDGATHLVTRLAATPEENEAAWSRLPRVRWSAAVGGLAPGATALAVHPYRIAGIAKMPIIAVQRVGDGKVMFSGLEETWRWRRGVGDEFHYRFWAQAVRWMVKRQFTEGDPRARLSIDRTECDVGEAVQVEAYCLGADGYPLQDAAVALDVTDSAGRHQRLAMQPAPGGWGVYRAVFSPAGVGKYEMQPIVSTYGDAPLPSKAALDVSRVDLEKGALAENVAALKAIAEASGGKFLAPAESDRLAALLAATRQSRMLTAEYSPCRNWIYYASLVALLGAAWFVRKRSGLA